MAIVVIVRDRRDGPVDLEPDLTSHSAPFVPTNRRAAIPCRSASYAAGSSTAEAIAARALPANLREMPVERVMSYETVCLDVATPVHRAASYVVAMNVRRILVVEKRDLVGIMSCLDLVACLTES